MSLERSGCRQGGSTGRWRMLRRRSRIRCATGARSNTGAHVARRPRVESEAARPVPVQRPVAAPARFRSWAPGRHPARPGSRHHARWRGLVIYAGRRATCASASSYYSPLGYAQDGRPDSTLERIDAEVVGCELEALVLESLQLTPLSTTVQCRPAECRSSTSVSMCRTRGA